MDIKELILEVEKLKDDVYIPSNSLAWDYKETKSHADGQLRAYNKVLMLLNEKIK